MLIKAKCNVGLFIFSVTHILSSNTLLGQAEVVYLGILIQVCDKQALLPYSIYFTNICMNILNGILMALKAAIFNLFM